MARRLWLALLVQGVASFTPIPRPRLSKAISMQFYSRLDGSDMEQVMGDTLRDACSQGDNDGAQAILMAILTAGETGV